MKKIWVLLCVLLSLTACGRQEAPAETTTTATTDVSGESLSFVGQWHTTNDLDEASTEECWVLRKDGVFIRAPSRAPSSKWEGGSYDEGYAFKAGHWQVSDGKLLLKMEDKLQLCPWEELKCFGKKYVYNISWLLFPLTPPEEEAYRVAQEETDPETGRRVIAVDEQLFYDFTGELDFIIKDYEKYLEQAKRNPLS